MSQTNLTNVKVVPDVDLWKLEIMFGKSYYSVILRRQDNLSDVMGRLLALAKKLDNALPDRATELRNEAEAGEHTCPLCFGKGYFLVKGDYHQPCGVCNGTGQV